MIATFEFDQNLVGKTLTVGFASSNGSYIADFSDDNNQIAYYCEIESLTPGVIIPKVNDDGGICVCSS